MGGQESRRSAEASECAKLQGKFWEYHDYLFTHQSGEGQGAFSDANLKAMAATLGLDAASFNACFDKRSTRTAVERDEALARSVGANQTPWLLVNGKLIDDPLSTEEVQRAIEAALAQ